MSVHQPPVPEQGRQQLANQNTTESTTAEGQSMEAPAFQLQASGSAGPLQMQTEDGTIQRETGDPDIYVFQKSDGTLYKVYDRLKKKHKFTLSWKDFQAMNSHLTAGNLQGGEEVHFPAGSIGSDAGKSGSTTANNNDTYTFQASDVSLYKIFVRMGGSTHFGIDFAALTAMNSHVKLSALNGGETLYFPKGTVASTPAVQPKDEYTFKVSDKTLYSVYVKFGGSGMGITLAEFQALNGHLSLDSLNGGETIYLPAGTLSSTTTTEVAPATTGSDTPVVTTPVVTPVAPTTTTSTTNGGTTVAPATTTTTAPTAATTTTTTTAKADHNLGLTGSVGLKQTNAAADVAKVRAKLVAYGFLADDKKDQASLNTAIGKFQRDVMGMSKGDQQISAGGGTDRALTTYYTAVVSDFSTIKTAQKDISVTTTSAPSSFATDMAGHTINSSSTAADVDIKAMIAVQDRLKQFKSRYMGKSHSNKALKAVKDKKNADLTAAEKKMVKTQITQTVAGLKRMQEGKGSEHVDDWAGRKKKGSKTIYMLTGTTTKPAYKKGQIADGDTTFLLLKKREHHAFTFDVDGKSVTRKSGDHVSSSYTKNPEGVGYSGTQKPGSSPLKMYTDTGLSATKAKALKHASKHEGKYDGINGYDRALMSFGFIQFAGGGRSLEYLFARIKSEHPSVWQNNFAKYGIDVEYKTGSTGTIVENSCRIVVQDVDNNKTVRGDAATELLASDMELTGVLMRAGTNTTVQQMQIAVAKSKYVDPANRSTLRDYKMSVLVVKDAKGNQVDVKVDLKRKNFKGKWQTKKSEIAAYKKTAAYTTANKAGLVTEANLTDTLNSLSLGAIMQSEKEQAALIGTYINSPKYSRYAFGDAIVAIIEEDGLTSEAQIKSIGVDKLLRKAEGKSQHKLHPKRIKEAREAKDLKG